MFHKVHTMGAMELLCPEIDQLVSCCTCGALQCLPPFKMCLGGHVACPPCIKYMQRCACGQQFAVGSHATFDWLVTAMKLRCKYRTRSSTGVGGDGGGDDDCVNRWYDVNELLEHYRTVCVYNKFVCPLSGCDHTCRIETAAEHYETAHGPIEEVLPNHLRPDVASFTIPYASCAEILRKVFNGYFLFIVIPQESHHARNPKPRLILQNINPSDTIRYYYYMEVLQNRTLIQVNLVTKVNENVL